MQQSIYCRMDIHLRQCTLVLKHWMHAKLFDQHLVHHRDHHWHPLIAPMRATAWHLILKLKPQVMPGPLDHRVRYLVFVGRCNFLPLYRLQM